jgi:hypothetical protein
MQPLGPLHLLFLTKTPLKENQLTFCRIANPLRRSAQRIPDAFAEGSDSVTEGVGDPAHSLADRVNGAANNVA